MVRGDRQRDQIGFSSALLIFSYSLLRTLAVSLPLWHPPNLDSLTE